MTEAQEWVAYIAQVNAVELAKAERPAEKSPEVLDAGVGDMIQYGAK